jgi:hypothetical protein
MGAAFARRRASRRTCEELAEGMNEKAPPTGERAAGLSNRGGEKTRHSPRALIRTPEWPNYGSASLARGPAPAPAWQGAHIRCCTAQTRREIRAALASVVTRQCFRPRGSMATTSVAAVEGNGYSRITINKRAYSAAPPRFPDAARGHRRSAAQDGWRPLVHSLATILPGRRLGRHSKPAGCASRQRIGHNIVRDKC